MNKLVLASWICFNLAELDEVKLSWILKEGERPRCAIVFENLLCRLGEGGEGRTEVPLGVVGGRRLDAQNGDEIRWLPFVNRHDCA